MIEENTVENFEETKTKNNYVEFYSNQQLKESDLEFIKKYLENQKVLGIYD